MKRIVNSVIDLIKDNQNILTKLEKEDQEICAIDFRVNQLIDRLQKYKNQTIKNKEAKKILISHYGNPYITAILCMEAIVNNWELIIAIEEVCYGLNTALVKMIKDCLKEYKIHRSILLKMNITASDIEKIDLEQVICLGNSNAYMNFRKIKNKKIQYIPFGDIALYYDTEEYEELIENIRNYAIQNLYEIEIFDETEELEDVMDMINHGLTKYCAVILSKDKEKQEKFKHEISSQIVCVNENPFLKFEWKIGEKIENVLSDKTV